MTAPDGGRRPRIVVATGTFPDPDAVVEHYRRRADIGFANVLAHPGGSTVAADAVVVATQALAQDTVAALAPTVRVIGRTGVGLDSIDLAACARHGIGVVNQPAYGATEVASHAVAMMLSLHRKLGLSDRFVRQGWTGPFSLGPMKALDEATLGLVGCGRIGAQTARMATPLVARVLAYDPGPARLPDGVVAVDSLAELLTASDLVSVHTPLTAQTRGLLGAAELAFLPAGAIVVNVARGGIIDEAALAAGLVSGRLGGAGLDVFAHEPLPADSPLLSAPNTVFSPHVAAFSDRSMWRLVTWTIDDVLSWLDRRQVEHGNVAVAGTR